MAKSDNATVADAMLLIQEVKEALQRGTKHYNKAGKLLATSKEILECLIQEGAITFEPRKPD